MKVLHVILFTFFLFGSTPVFSQIGENPRTHRKHGLSLSLGDYSILGLTYDVFIFPQLNTGLTIGIGGFSGSFEYHPFGGNLKKRSYYLGLRGGKFISLSSSTGDELYYSLYLPIGFSYIVGSSGFNFALDFGPTWTEDDSIEIFDNGLAFIGRIRIGYRFKN